MVAGGGCGRLSSNGPIHAARLDKAVMSREISSRSVIILENMRLISSMVGDDRAVAAVERGRRKNDFEYQIDMTLLDCEEGRGLLLGLKEN